MDFLFDKIKRLSLSKTELKIADYLLDNSNTIGLKTATEVADEIGVSDSSVIRFVRLLGFKGYGDFKREMSGRLEQHYNEFLSPRQKYIRAKESINEKDLISDVVEQTILNLNKSVESLDMSVINAAADILITSKRKYIVGFRGTASCVLYMSRKLILFLPNIISCVNHDSSVIEQMIDISSEDCIVLYTFPRYTKITQALLELAKKRRAKIIVITDRLTAPSVGYADLIIPVAVEGVGHTNSYVVPLCISDMILLTISGRGIDSKNDRIAQLDDYINKYDLY
ncbi:MAG TPA: MurR/RpiR family transcriptional regulator [Syntrophomonas sp.]|nr:MurR/RpiR family transcriptional regulator [Syntrophomonas sp.]